MPRVSGIYSLPSGTKANSGATVASVPYNTFLDDLVSDLNGARPVTAGGTGATTASGARAALGAQQADDTLTALAGVATAADKLIYATGTDAFATTTLTAFARTLLDDASAAAVIATLGLGALATANTVSNANWSGTDLSVANGGTGASDAAGARANLGLGGLAIANTVNNDNWSGTDLAIANGGTGASDAAGARANLGLGGLATVNTVNDANWSGADLSIANGGTGASDAAGARANLGIVFASVAQMQAGVATGVIADPAGVAAAVDVRVGTKLRKYVSAPFAIVNGARTTLDHGLGGVPDWWQVQFRCLIAENGYAVGDELDLTGYASGSSASRSFVSIASESQIKVQIGSTGCAALTASGGGFVLTAANWRVVVRAYRWVA